MKTNIITRGKVAVAVAAILAFAGCTNTDTQALQDRITALENAIADRREFYNDTVNANNTRIEQFPDLVIARTLNFRHRDLLEFADDEKRDVDMKSLFS